MCSLCPWAWMRDCLAHVISLIMEAIHGFSFLPWANWWITDCYVLRMHYLSEILDELVIFLWKILTSQRKNCLRRKIRQYDFSLRSKVSLGFSSSLLSCFLTSRLENIQLFSIHVDDVDPLEVFLSDLSSVWKFSSVQRSGEGKMTSEEEFLWQSWCRGPCRNLRYLCGWQEGDWCLSMCCQ